MSIKQLWVEKHRPSKISDYVFHDQSQKQQVINFIEEGSIPNLLFTGVQGSGKTTLARLLIDELQIDKDMDLLVINGSDENGVDAIRDKIKNFAYGYSLGTFKVVLIEEGDYLTQGAQAILRALSEDVSDSCRFIITCNHKNKIIPAIRSRFQMFEFKASDKADVVSYCATVLISENIKFDLDLLMSYVDKSYPDIRKIVNTLQQYSSNGELQCQQVNDESDSSDYKRDLLKCLEEDKFSTLRKIVADNVSDNEYEDLYKFLYENLHLVPRFKNTALYEKGIVIIANYLYRSFSFAVQEINFAACAIELGNIQ